MALDEWLNPAGLRRFDRQAPPQLSIALYAADDAMDDFRPSSREERIAYNEAWCRELNERKALWMRKGLPAAGFRCECGQINCGARFHLSGTQWKEARERPDRFVVAPGHVARDIEVVVKEYPDFWMVEKQGEAEEIVEDLE